uniref:MADF domain-containing protein n=1 Tax=Heliothis virescens TaxID=7102 RepID=A0A2A4JA00_HELVI
MAKKIGPEENFWTPFQQDIMKMVQRHPITYIRDIMMTPTQYKAAVTTAWDRISRDIHVPQKLCKQEWTSIKFRYAKLNNMIRHGKLTEEIVQMHPKTSKYMDGSLDFMDAYIYEITDEEIPTCIHKRFNKMFGVTNKQVVTKEMVQALLKKRTQEEEPNDEMGKMHVQNLMNIVENAVERSLREMSSAEEQPEHRTAGLENTPEDNVEDGARNWQ